MPKQRRKPKIWKKPQQDDPLRTEIKPAEPPSMNRADLRLSEMEEAAEAQGTTASLEVSTLQIEDIEVGETPETGPAGAALLKEALRAETSAYDAVARAMEDAEAAGREAEREVARAVREAERSCAAEQRMIKTGEEDSAGE